MRSAPTITGIAGWAAEATGASSSRRRFSRSLAFGFLILVAASAVAQPPTSDDPTDRRLVVVVDAGSQQGWLRQNFDVWLPRRSGETTLLVSELERRRIAARGLVPVIDREQTRALAAARALDREASVGGGIPGFSCYRTVDETNTRLVDLASSRPGVATVVDIGDSWEKQTGSSPGDDVLALQIGGPPGPQRPPFVLIGAVHAREYTTAELALRFAEWLVESYGDDPEATWLVDERSIHVIPVANPDGRRRAETGLSWRKNTDNDFCTGSNSRGVDLNRNSTHFFGGPFSSGFECSETYRGPSAASEPETVALESHFAAVLEDQWDGIGSPPDDTEGLVISLHSFGELVLYPWEGITDAAPNEAAIATLGRKFGFSNDYEVCQDCLAPASGTTVDAAYAGYGVPAYTFELGTTFFQSCSAFLGTILDANLDALVYAAKAARRPYLEPSGPEAVNVSLSSRSVRRGSSVSLMATLDDTRYDSNGHGTEPTQSIAAAYYRIGSPPHEGPGLGLAAQDGGFDSPVEAVVGSIDTSSLASGRHLIFVYGEDADGNVGVPTGVFLDVLGADLIFADGFESGDTSLWSSATR